MTSGALVSGPYAHSNRSTARIMGLVMLALLPATGYGVYQFGWPALFLLIVTLLSAVGSEALCLRLAGKPVGAFLLDGSALLSGWLLVLTLPPWAPWWIGVSGGVTAIVIGKQVFGGIGQNLFNPAMVARVVLLISFPLEMTTFPVPHPLPAAGSPGFLDSLGITFGAVMQTDAVSSATVLGGVKTALVSGLELPVINAGGSDWHTMVLGSLPGSFGETSALLVVAGGILLLATRVISWHIPAAMIGTLMLLAGGFHLLDPAHYPGALHHLLAGATLLGAFFIATDLVTSPVTSTGQLLFGAGCGALVYVIRTWASYPEGMAFAIMLMNALTPLIDHYLKPRVYGRDRKGNPIITAAGQD
jgi:electron transport complex protein RnfD